jgi:outer membrane lipoprotein SlyB
MSNYLLSMLALGAFSMQAAPTPKPAPQPAVKPAMTLTLSGCVTQDAATPGAFTFSDAKTGTKYRLSTNGEQKNGEQKNDWKRGEFTVGHFTIRGGLVPSPNVAAQQGALDPAKTANAGQPGGSATGTGVVGLPEFRATQVSASKGKCP